MTSEHRKKRAHVDDDLVVVLVLIVVLVHHILSGYVLKSTLDVLFDFLTALVLSLPIFLQNSIYSFLDGLLVTFFTNFHDLANHNILEPILKQVDLGPMLFDLLVTDDLRFELLVHLALLLLVRVQTFLTSVSSYGLFKPLLEEVLLA